VDDGGGRDRDSGTLACVARFDDEWVPATAWHGVFTPADAYGMSRAQVRHRLRTGTWRRVLGDALAHRREVDTAQLRAKAAALTWPEGVVCLTSAAALHGIPVVDDGLAHLRVPSPRARRGLLVPHRFELAGADVMGIGGIAVTTRRRTVIDCLGRLPTAEALELLAWASSRRVVDADGLRTWLDGHPNAWGNTQRRRVLARLQSGAMSGAELLLHQLLRRARIRGWVAGASLREVLGVWAVADVWFADVRLVIEVDGRRAHGPDQFQHDRTRQNALVAAGCTVLRYTWHDLTTHPDTVAHEIQALLAALRARKERFWLQA
jgi:very-short-patch-repair endonuclease